MRLKRWLLSFIILFSTSSFANRPLRVLVSTLPLNPDPVPMWNYQHFMIAQSLYDTLIKYSEKGNIVANLAKKWSISEKGTLYTFELDQTKKFSDGSPVTASDVHLSLSRHFWKGSKSVIVDYLSEVLDCPTVLEKGELLPCFKVLGTKSFSIRLKGPYPPFLNVLSMLGNCVYKIRPDGSFLGSGPFSLKSYNDKLWKLERKEPIKLPLNVPTSLDLHRYDDQAQVQDMLTSKRVDLVVGLTPALIRSVKMSLDYGVVSHQSMAFSHFYLNTEKPPFNDENFRKAFRDFFEEKVLQTLPEKAEYFTRMHQFICPGLMPRPYYQKKNSVSKNWDDVIKREKREILLVFREEYTENSLFKRLDEVIKTFGLNWKVKRINSGQFMDEMKAKKYNLITGAYLASFPDPDGFLSPINRKNSLQYGAFDTSSLFEKIAKARHTEDRLNRLNDYTSILKEFEEKDYIVPGYQFYLPIVYRKGLKVPNWDYKHEGEFWHVIWETKVEVK